MTASNYPLLHGPHSLREWSRDWGGRFVIAAAFYLAAYLFWLSFTRGTDEQVTAVCDLASFPLGLLMTVLAWRAARHERLDASTRRAWRLLTLANACYVVANLIWCYYEIVLHTEATTSWADPFYLAYYPLLLSGLLSFPVMPRTVEARLTFGLDAATVMVGAGMIVWYFILRPIAVAENSGLTESIVALAYPLGDLVMVFGILAVTQRRPPASVRGALTILTIALIIQPLADLVYAYKVVQGTYQTGSGLDALWMFGYFFFAAAAQYQHLIATRGIPEDRTAEQDAKAFNWLPYVGIALGYGLLLAVTYNHRGETGVDQIHWLVLGAVALTGVVVARQIVAVRENARLLAEQSARRSELRFRALVQHSSDVVTILGPGGTILYTSPSVERLLGYGTEELVDRRAFDFIHPEDVEPLTTAFQALERGSQSFVTTEYRFRHRDGSWRVLEGISKIFSDDTGAAVTSGVLINSRDITERKQAEEKLRAYTVQLQQSNRELQDFAFVASHDLQEPLRKVQAFGDRLKSKYGDQLAEDGRDYLERMQSAAGRMQTLIKDLLTFSRVTTKAQPFTPVDLTKITHEVLRDLEVKVEETGASFSIEGLPTIDADPMQMRHLLQNLIGNALKFRHAAQTPAIKIHSHYATSEGGHIRHHDANRKNGSGHDNAVPNGFCRIVVEDNGIGFDEKYVDRIFTVFQRLHGRTEYEGSGIGLAVCRKIVERHGGSLTARSAPGEGASFIATLPMKQNDQGATV